MIVSQPPRTARIAVVSDLHLGHRKTATRFIVDNLNKVVTHPNVFSQLDIFFIAGDLFDDLLMLSQDEISTIQEWIFRTLALCAKYKVKFRLLKGTPSHDRDQSSWVESIASLCKDHFHGDIDFVYQKDIAVEYFDQWNLKVIYVPDEARPTGMEILRDAKLLAAKQGWQSVDLAIMHGFFKYQIPVMKAHTHALDEEDWLDFVTGGIFIGHVHTHSRYKGIFAQGSFDRLTHGQEEAKGFARAIVAKDFCQADFVENPGAMVYRTLVCNHEDVDKAIEYIDRNLKRLHQSVCHIRIRANDAKPILQSERVLKNRYPQVRWSFDKIKSEQDLKKHMQRKARLHESLIINKHTLHDQLLERLTLNGVSKEEMLLCSALIQETVSKL
jgi:hypothetical protein